MKEELIEELIEATIITLDMLGINIKRAFPNIYNEWINGGDKGE